MFGGDSAVPGNVVVGNITFSPVKTGANPQVGVGFVEFLAEEETQWQIAKIRGFFLPAHKNVLADPQVTTQGSYAGYEANAQVIVDVLLNEETHPIPPFSKNGSTIWTEWSYRFGRVLLTNESITDILDEMQAKAEELLA
jgi:ABC-type glycerol-3-phosphate transport system substrate-binding protein